MICPFACSLERNGKLMYARGFGHADVEKKKPVEPDALVKAVNGLAGTAAPTES